VRPLGAPEQQADHDRGDEQCNAERQVGYLFGPPPTGGGLGGLRGDVAAQLAEGRIRGAPL
jgi:hypothetical protein